MYPHLADEPTRGGNVPAHGNPVRGVTAIVVDKVKIVMHAQKPLCCFQTSLPAKIK
jgi:hypothetical protein